MKLCVKNVLEPFFRASTNAYNFSWVVVGRRVLFCVFLFSKQQSFLFFLYFLYILCFILLLNFHLFLHYFPFFSGFSNFIVFVSIVVGQFLGYLVFKPNLILWLHLLSCCLKNLIITVISGFSM